MSEPPKTQQIINISDLANRLGVSRATVHNWLRDGCCPIAPVEGLKPPKWRLSDVTAWIAGNADNA